jgi:hypothetical protein
MAASEPGATAAGRHKTRCRRKQALMKLLNPRRVLAGAILAALAAVSLLAQPPTVQRVQDLSDAAVKRAIETSVAELGSRGLFSGIVLAARGSQPIAVGAAGYADRARKTRITPSTRFTIGSMGKMFTATAIGQLAGDLPVSAPRGTAPASTSGCSGTGTSRMVERRGRVGLLHEPPLAPGVPDVVGRKHPDDDEAVEVGVVGLDTAARRCTSCSARGIYPRTGQTPGDSPWARLPPDRRTAAAGGC